MMLSVAVCKVVSRGTLDQLDDGHRGGIAAAEAGFDDASVAALAIDVAWGYFFEYALDDVAVVEHFTSLTAQVNGAVQLLRRIRHRLVSHLGKSALISPT